ncbi:hypothetical protein A4G99_06540 [Haladaptatus sp. R4]|nr:hypothetical protein A4G99_06540 [Haladaptatus sp. R4]
MTASWAVTTEWAVTASWAVTRGGFGFLVSVAAGRNGSKSHSGSLRTGDFDRFTVAITENTTPKAPVRSLCRSGFGYFVSVVTTKMAQKAHLRSRSLCRISALSATVARIEPVQTTM